MSGLHGKNAELRIQVSESAQTAFALTRIASTRIYQAASNKRNWKYGRELTTVTIDLGNGSTEQIDPQSPYINYPGGAIVLPPHLLPAQISGITANAVVTDLAGVSAKPGCTRKFNVDLDTPILDATCIGDSFKSKVTGIPDFKGMLDGLYVDADLWDYAIAGVSGITPRFVLRFRPDPLDETTYYQGTVIFPKHSFAAGFDSLIEDKIEFEGDGPLQAIKAGVPSFPNIPTS